MKFLILSDMFSLESWLIDNQVPKIMPAVYELFKHLGQSKEHSFICLIFHRKNKKRIDFPNGSYIQILPLPVPGHYTRKFFSLFSMYGVARKLCKTHSFDVVYGMSIYSLVARKIGKQFSIYSTARIFGSLVRHVLQQKKYFKLYTRHILQYFEMRYPCDLTICTEDGTEFDVAIKELGFKHNLHLLLNGINPELKRTLMSLPAISKIPIDEPIQCISIGRLTHWKRHDLAIDTIYFIKKNHHLNVQLSILGAGEEYNRLQTKIRKLGLESNVSIIPPVAHKQLPEVLSQYQIGLFLYDASNLGNALWETCLSGRLVVARSTGKTDMFLTDNVHTLLVSDNAIEIAEKVNAHLQTGNGTIPDKCRTHISSLLPNWKDRIDAECKLISQASTTMP